jgi:hypothetical protein
MSPPAVTVAGPSLVTTRSAICACAPTAVSDSMNTPATIPSIERNFGIFSGLLFQLDGRAGSGRSRNVDAISGGCENVEV